MTDKIIPFSLKDAPSLIEHVFPVQRLSIDVFKERMAGASQTLTSLGSYWKGRKPLILNRACILASLLPATNDLKKDLEIFELLMSMDDESLHKRLNLKQDTDLPVLTYRELASKAKRAEEIPNIVSSHIWEKVNLYLGTSANSYQDLVRQLGIMRFGRIPKVGDTFSGSGQIPFEAAKLGCDTYASDLNPIACLLTWGAFNIVGADKKNKLRIQNNQSNFVAKVKSEIDSRNIESDGSGWKAKVYLYCIEVKCPETGWIVPVLPSLVISKGKNVIASLVPNRQEKRFDIKLISNATEAQVKSAAAGTYQNQQVIYTLDGVEHRVKMSSIRGDFTEIVDGVKANRNKLRKWGISDVGFNGEDIFQERLYAIQWVRDDGSVRPESEFRSVTINDLEQERNIRGFVEKNLSEWQLNGWIPDVKIESGDETDRLTRERGWTYWHHLFNPRQLMYLAIARKHVTAETTFVFQQAVNLTSRLCGWNGAKGVGRWGSVEGVFVNQALNTLWAYGCRSIDGLLSGDFQIKETDSLPKGISRNIINCASSEISYDADLFITDPPYGDAVKYEEILEFFIAWLQKSPPDEFKSWIWDSRRALAIKGEDHDFKLSMVDAYKRMTDHLSENGLQIIMFTHQSGSIWADMANIVWASGLRVSAAWYIVTETDSALRDGQYVKGTILLILRKRSETLESFRDELAYEIKDEVENQVQLLAGLNSNVKDLYKDENLFEDADIQMAGYAAALRVLTKYSKIDGVDMPKESLRPRIREQKTLVDDLIEFAVNIANQYLVPQGLTKDIWDSLGGSERFYLKMLDMESRSIFALSNYQNFAKAFKVDDFSVLIGETKANKTQLKSSEAFGKRGIGASDEFGSTTTRMILYATYLLIENKVTSDDVLHQLKDLVPDFYRKRDLLIAIADYISKKTSGIRDNESQSARVLRDLIRNERV